MEIVSLIVGIVDKYAVAPAIRQVGYLTHCKSKLEKLQTQVDELSAAGQRLELKVVEAEENGETIHTDVQKWRDEVVENTKKANELWKPDTQAKMSCLRGVCPNPVLRYKLGRRSTKLQQVVVELYAKRDFASISYNVRPQEVCVVSYKHYGAFDSRTLTVKKIMDELKIPNTDLILVFGIGGVGKTTLVEEVLRQAVKEKLFADAVMVTSVQNPDLEGIQKEIAIKLGMEVKESDTMAVRATRLCDRVKDKKVLVILDNILESIDLQSVGLPCLPNCRILLTSRTRKLLSSEKRSQKDFELQVLNEEDAWRLFETKVGDVVKNPDIRTVATDVAKKCRGWPLLVVTVASSLRNRRTLPVWSDALRKVEVFDNEDSAEQEAYPALEWSYSQLDDQRLKPLFLICGILVHLGGSYTSLTSLLKCTFGLGLFKKNIDSVEHAQNALHSWIEELKDSCLLLDSEDNTSIRMHDLLRDVAISIASKDQHALLRAQGDELQGDELKEWPNNDFLENCKIIALSCKNIPRLPEVLKCQQLEFFILEGKGLEIPGNFFEEMKELKVMDLTSARISSLPPSLHLLQNLRTLCLDGCVLRDITLVGQLSQLEILSFMDSNFKELPEEIGKLTRLRLLDLSGCFQLKVISPNVISRLTSLEDLRMRESFKGWVPEGVTGERSNASLSELKELPHLVALSIHVPDAGSIPTDLFTDKLKRYQILIGTSWEWDDVDETLNTLKLKLPTGCELDRGLEMLLKRSCVHLDLDGSNGADNVVYRSGSEDFQKLKHLHVENNAQFTHIITEEVVLPNLTSLEVRRCNLLTFVLSSSMARNLVQLQKLEITKCESMEEIVSTKEYGEEKTDVMFCKLQHLKLRVLPKLSRFCSASCNVQFPCLESLELVKCGQLKGFVFDPKPETGKVYFLFDKKVVLPNLTSLEVRRCNLLTFVLSSSMARNLVQLQTLVITECKSMEEIVSTKEYGEEKTDVMFCKLQHLKLRVLPKLSRFCSASCNVQFPCLESLELVECGQLKGFVFDPKPETREVYFLFDKKVVLPNLTSLEVRRCNLLTFVLSSSMARNLVQLQKLEITECESMEEIVSTKEYGEEKSDVMFCKLQHLNLRYLPKLSRFCSASCNVQFPSLESLKLVECGELKGFVFDPKPETGEVYFLFDKKVVLPNLTSLEVRHCNLLTFVLSSSMARNLVQLQKLEITECESMEEIVSTKEYGEEKSDVMFCKLQHLELGVLPKLSRFCSASCNVQFPCLESLELVKCGELKGFVFDPKPETEEVYFLFDKKVVLPNLTSLEVRRCNLLTFVLSSSMARNLVQLQKLEITKCESMEEIVSTKEYGEEKSDVMFCKLQHLNLRYLPKLSRFCSASCNVQFPCLESLKLVECGELKGFVFDPKPETEEVYFLFDDKVGFPKLEILSIRELSISTTVWHNKLDPGSFYKLRYVDVGRCGRLISIITPSIAGRLNALTSLSISRCHRLEVVFEIKETPDTSTTQLKMSGCENLDSVSIKECGKLKYIFPCSVARGLQQLRHLRVHGCVGMEEIVSKEEGLEMMPKFVFPKATQIEFINLDQLKSFYPGIHASEWPLLERVEVRKCGKLDIFVSKISSFQKHELDGLHTPIKHSLFLIDKDVSFPNLENMTLDADMEIPLQLFGKLKSLTFDGGQQVSLFENNVHPDATFPHLSVLSLHHMEKLMHLRNENVPGAGPVFPNLEVLRVEGCSALKDIGSSAIPFKNLTTLVVVGCRSLKYLATYTIAKTLKRLIEMKVGDCERMTEIGATASDGDDAGNDGEISFSQLQSLELFFLPSLQDFFSGNCIVKFPSLKTVHIYECPKLKINCIEWKSSPELQGVRIT